ncbi:hypothetical protein HHI36_020670 [Cryptolaemus montrouzieri]|uniref:Uncharacterized protein n=1 Tax=Cryptolaemus montrouzieri TaxID=559131 RepID=A0ABD2NCK8_9CUCU
MDISHPHRADFGKILHLYLELRKYHLNMNDFVNPLLAIWLLSATFSLIFNIYVTVILVKSGFSEDIAITIFRITVSFGLLDYIMTSVQRYTHQNDNLLQFLFKYPISRLKIEEALQVEMLIRTLVSLKPTITASDMFVIGTGLLASLSGVVVTYVLVALQFQPAWAK